MRQTRLWPGCALLLCLAASLYRFPGISNVDTMSQRADMLSKEYHDWHPPIFAAFWGILNDIWNSVTGMQITGTEVLYMTFVFMFWGGAALILRRAKNFWASFAGGAQWKFFTALALFVFLGLFELVPMLRFVWKDTAMFAAYTLALGIILNFPSPSKKLLWRIGALVTALLLLFYGTAVRHNAIFAVLPLLSLLLICFTGKRKFTFILPLTLVIWGIMLFSAHLITYRVLTTHKQYSLQEILYGDIWKLNYRSKTFDLPPPVNGRGWEPLDRDVFFAFFVETHHIVAAFHYINTYYRSKGDLGVDVYRDFNGAEDDFGELQKAWFEKVKKHPSRYFNLRKRIMLDLLRNFSFMGQTGLIYFIFSILVTGVMLYKFVRKKKFADLVPYFVVASGLLYVLPYFFIAPDAVRRYLFWFYLASFYGVVWFANELRSKATEGKKF
jgi:hypothetical protein